MTAREPKAWELPDDETKRLLAAPDRRTLQGKRDSAALAVLARCGLRKQELCNLDVGDFSPGRPASLNVTTLKKGRPRVLPLTPETAKLVLEYLKSRPDVLPGDPLFLTLGRHGPWAPCRLTPVAVDEMVKGARTAAGITSHLTPHSLRHNLATQALRCGTLSSAARPS